MCARITVAFSTFRETYYKWVVELLDELEKQTVEDFEVVIVVNCNRHYFRELQKVATLENQTRYQMQVVFNPIDRGIAHSRNMALRYARTPFLAFTDDDAIPHPRWLEELLYALKLCRKVAAATGPVLCSWQDDAQNFASWFPKELYWIVGCTSTDIGRVAIVRNGFGSNLALRRDILLKTGAFDESLGYNPRNPITGEETELGARFVKAGYITVWNPNAVVYHRIPRERLRMRSILTRSFIEGKTKARLSRVYGSSVLTSETQHLASLVKRFIETKSFRSKALLLQSTLAVVMGYLAYRVLHPCS